MTIPRTLCLPGNKCRIYLTDRCLLGTKASSDTRLFSTHHGLRNIECIGQYSAQVENNLCRADAVKPAVSVYLTVCSAGLHICLLRCLYAIGVLNNLIALRQNFLYISMLILLMMNEIALFIACIYAG